MLRTLILLSLLALPAAAQEEMDLGSPPAGTYTTDPAHTRLWFIVDHLDRIHETRLAAVR